MHYGRTTADGRRRKRRVKIVGRKYLIRNSRFAIRGSQFAGSQFAVRSSRFAVRGSQFAVRGSRFAGRNSRFAIRGSQFAVRGSRVVRLRASARQALPVSAGLSPASKLEAGNWKLIRTAPRSARSSPSRTDVSRDGRFRAACAPTSIRCEASEADRAERAAARRAYRVRPASAYRSLS